MAPLSDKISSHEKCPNDSSSDNKPSKFSIRWLLKRSKSSKSAREMAQAEKLRPSAVAVSKSCDSGIASFSTMDKCSAFLLWKLLPAKGKALIGQDKCRSSNQTRMFKTSFSCNDVSRMLPPSKLVASTRSSYNIPTTSEAQSGQSKRSSLLSYGMCKCNTNSVDCLNSPQQYPHDFTPNVCQLVLCKLCLAMVPAQNMYSLESCGCCFCVACMQQYLFINIKEGNVSIMCPDAECTDKGRVRAAEIEDLVGDELFYKFQKFKLNNDVDSDPCRTWCPTPGCETICHIQPSKKQETGVLVHCLNCKLSFCSSCKLKWHGGKTCEEIRYILQEEEEFNMSDEEESVIKRCPNCRVPIERDEGCAQMMCKCCKHVFCWHCLASLDDDFLLRHYDKGPCRNKLGHSRASMVWHRTQVIGIFAGFSFLLLIASPILLLAAPCLLCCRCKNRKLFYEEATLI